MSSSTLAAGLRSLRGKLAYQHRYDESDEQLLHAFTSCRDDSAFAVLVRRHGPMVLQVCRRVLGHLHDAEDAFQATFLVLARNAASLRDKAALATWLHGTAYRTALKAKQTAARRRKHEEQTPARALQNPSDDLLWSEVRALLDEEIARLPKNYRSVFVLCCLENKSQAEAGRRLGLKQRTVSHRLAEARKQLAQQLARRGVELTVLLATVALPSALPSELMAKTIAAALVIAAGDGLTSVAPAAVAELVHRTTAAMMASKVKILTAVLMLVAASGSLVGLLVKASGPLAATTELPAAKADDKPKAAPAQSDSAKTVSIQGRVLDPDGKPATGARVYVNLIPDLEAAGGTRLIATITGKEGRYSLVIPRAKLIVPQTKVPLSRLTIVATAKGYGPDWREVPVGELSKETTLQLVKDDVPIQGRILSLEGKRLSGIKVSLHSLQAFPKGDFERVLRAERNGTQFENVTDVQWLWLSTDHPARTVTTDADGRFRLDGIGRERIARLFLEGTHIHYSSIDVMTCKGESVRGPHRPGPIHAATFEYLAKPSRVIRGTVRERDTGKPIAGIRIRGSETTADTTTDKQGRYELPGYAKADYYRITAYPIHGQAYFFGSVAIKDTEGLGPVTADLEMVRGIPFEGKVLDGETGKPVQGGISYYPLAPNPNVTGHVGGGAAWTVGPFSEASISADGSFHCIVLPGPGFIGVQARHAKRYMSACVDPRTIKALYNKELLAIPSGGGSVMGTSQEQFQGILLINPDKVTKKIVKTIHLAVALEIKGTLLDPEGKPVTGARVRGLEESYSWGTMATEKFSITSVNPQRPRKVCFLHQTRRLIGSVEVKGTETKPLTVRMQPWAAVRGRLVDTEGRPMRNVKLYGSAFLPENRRTNEQGRFRLEGLIPGLPYDFTYEKNKPFAYGTVLKGFVGKPGEVRDLGDVRGQPHRQE